MCVCVFMYECVYVRMWICASGANNGDQYLLDVVFGSVLCSFYFLYNLYLHCNVHCKENVYG